MRLVSGADVGAARATGGASTLGPGAAIGRYTVKRLLGRGGFGAVYLALDEQLDRDVAIKLLPETTGDESVREARAMAKLQHPNVVTVHEVIELPSGDVAIVMEHVSGATLRDAMQTAPRDQLDELFHQAALGLTAAHDAGLVHRDFKPENILVGTDGRARVADFGLASGVTTRAQTGDESIDVSASIARGGTLVGTPAYMAPEQLRGDAADARSDQYAWCIAYWEVLTGARPAAQSATLADLRESTAGGPPDVPADSGPTDARVLGALRVGLATDPGDRYADMTTLVAAVDVARAVKRARPWVIPLGVAAVVAAVVGIAVTTSNRPATATAEPIAAPSAVVPSSAPSSRPLAPTRAEQLLEQGDLLGAEKSGLSRLNAVQAVAIRARPRRRGWS